MSEHIDEEGLHGRLSMWRAFGGGEPRVAIVFKVPYKALDVGVLNLFFSLVAYLPKSQLEAEFHRVVGNINAECEFLKNLGKDDVVRGVFNMLVAWKTDSMLSRYDVTAEEDLRDAMEKVTTYNEAESREVASISVKR